MITDAFEIVAGSPGAPVLFTCEHASMRVPWPWSWPAEDARLAGTHWSYDLGAAELTRELAAGAGAPAILARFTRLLIDPNRPLDSPTLFRDMADGAPVSLNTPLAPTDREQRTSRLYRRYHDALAGLAALAPPRMLSVHTFTPVYEGIRRTVELGVLYDSAEAAARRLAESLADTGLAIAFNEPWSGRQGLMHSVETHATRNGRTALEIELRQDRATDPEFRRWFVPRLLAALAAVPVR